MKTEKFQIEVDGITVDVTKKSIRNINLAVYQPGRVRLSSPHAVKDEALRQFVISRLGWIRKHIKKMKSRPREPKRDFIQGEGHKFQGHSYHLNIVEEDAPPHVCIRDDAFIDLYVRPGSSTAKKEAVLKEWYRSRLKEQIPVLIKKWEKELHVSVTEFGVKQMKTKWGTCNIRARRIWLNLELAKKPEHCLDYVVLHEMVHLLERLHNARFKAFMDRYMPDWRMRQKELNGFVD